MKKTILNIAKLMLMILICLMLGACSNSKKDSSKNNDVLSNDSMDTITINYNDSMDDGAVDVLWGPALFENMNIYNKNLALISASLLAAAGDSADDEYSEDHYIAEAYEKLGMNTTLYNYPNKTKNIDHTYINGNAKIVTKQKYSPEEQAFAIGYRDMKVNGKKTHVILITMRGTETFVEGSGVTTAIANKEFYGNKVYNYWYDYQEKVWTGLKDFVKKHEELQNGPTKILIGGHSLGGGAANLLGARFDYCVEDQGGHWKDVKWEGPSKKEDILTFTFGGLNAFENNSDNESNGEKFDNIGNIFNYWDTFGPNGDGVLGFKPGGGNDSSIKKFGKMIGFEHDYTNELQGDINYRNHNMQGYIRAIEDGIKWDITNTIIACNGIYSNHLDGDAYDVLVEPKNISIGEDDFTSMDKAYSMSAYQYHQDSDRVYDIRILPYSPNGVLKDDETPVNTINENDLEDVMSSIISGVGTEDLNYFIENYTESRNNGKLEMNATGDFGSAPMYIFSDDDNDGNIFYEYTINGKKATITGVLKKQNIENHTIDDIGEYTITLTKKKVNGYMKYVITNIKVSGID